MLARQVIVKVAQAGGCMMVASSSMPICCDARWPGDCQDGRGGARRQKCALFFWLGTALASLQDGNSVDVAAVIMHFSAGLVAMGLNFGLLAVLEMKAQKGNESK